MAPSRKLVGRCNLLHENRWGSRRQRPRSHPWGPSRTERSFNRLVSRNLALILVVACMMIISREPGILIKLLMVQRLSRQHGRKGKMVARGLIPWLRKGVRYRFSVPAVHFDADCFLGRPRGLLVDSQSNVLAMCATQVSFPKGTPRLTLPFSRSRSGSLKFVATT